MAPPRCQRTFRRLSGDSTWRWTCPFCPDAEGYEAVADAGLLAYANAAQAFCERQFGPPPDAARPTTLLLGARPECVLEEGDRRYVVYLQAGSDEHQLRLQIGHEMFHRVCSRGRVFDWTHEMLACVVSVRLLRRHGLSDYAHRTETLYRHEAAQLSLLALRSVDLWTTSTYPAGFYGRAYVTGAALAGAVGWDWLRTLPGSAAPAAPVMDAWLAGLPADQRVRAGAVLAPETRKDLVVPAVPPAARHLF